MAAARWGGRRAQLWTAAVLDRHRDNDGEVWCALRLVPACRGRADTGDHIIPRSVAPELQYDVANGQPACRPCNEARSAAPTSIASLVVDDRAFFDSAPTP